jgi:DNA polymerase III delta prime subunit
VLPTLQKARQLRFNPLRQLINLATKAPRQELKAQKKILLKALIKRLSLALRKARKILQSKLQLNLKLQKNLRKNRPRLELQLSDAQLPKKLKQVEQLRAKVLEATKPAKKIAEGHVLQVSDRAKKNRVVAQTSQTMILLCQILAPCHALTASGKKVKKTKKTLAKKKIQ